MLFEFETENWRGQCLLNLLEYLFEGVPNEGAENFYVSAPSGRLLLSAFAFNCKRPLMQSHWIHLLRHRGRRPAVGWR